MSEFSGITWPVILGFINLIFSSAIVITAFSLLGYMLTHNLRSEVAQSFSVLLACVLVVFAGDIIIPRAATVHAADIWLRVQWIGIALVPAAYLHFSHAVLQSTRHFSARRRIVVALSYLTSGVLVFLALFTDLLVYDGSFTPPINRLAAGPLFPVFVAYFGATAAYGAWNIIRARRRCLTPASRRRMTYLTISFAAPGLAVFPYLVKTGLTAGLIDRIPIIFILLMVMAANILIGTMLVLMAYSVAYSGVLSPDRVIKHDLVHYLLRGPVVGTLVIAVMLVIPRVEVILGLPRDTAVIFAVVGVIVLGELAVNITKPWIDRFLSPQDQEEIAWIQTLDRRLMTSSDLRQFLSNMLIGLCELLRVDHGFVLVQTDTGLRVEVSVGDPETARAFAESRGAAAKWDAFEKEQFDDAPEPAFRSDNDYWLCPLRSQDGERLLGLLGVRARTLEVEMDENEHDEAEALLTQAAVAIADRYVQQGIFATLQRMLPDLERIQEWRSVVRYAPALPTPPTASAASNETPPDAGALLAQTTWQQWVKDALNHYWGGPKLTENPLMDLRLVHRALRANDSNLTKALRAVLQEAIERQRPPGERKNTAPEWLVYNILDLRFVQGQRVFDIARRLSMSESDLYRKQRTAVAAVAKTLAEMEEKLAAEEAAGEQAVSVLAN
jgi:hypothetical protein